MLALRYADRAAAVHEPLVVPVPEMPASAPERALVSEPTVRLTAWIRGRVQGVGMRWWIRSRALELGLVGWARNLDDGRVEVVAEGPDGACRALLEALRGPSTAGRPGRIEGVVERISQAQGLTATDNRGFAER